MKKLWISGFAACLVLYMSSGVFAQDYEFSVAGADSLTGAAGSEHSGDYTVNLAHAGDGVGAQGWSLGVAVDGGVVTSVTTEGTTAAENFDSPFDNTSVIDPDRNGGQQGVVSAIVLSIVGNPAVLPPNSVSSILIIGTTFTIGDADSTGAIRVTDGLAGAGQPVDVVVTEAGNSAEFTVVDLAVALSVEVTCCGADYNVGFSADRLANTTAGEGIIDDGDLCNAIGVLEANGPTTVYANVSSDFTSGVQGWSISLEVSGDIILTDVTTDNTSAANEPDGLGQGAFNNTSIASPDNNDGKRGVVSAIVLCLTGCGATLAPVGTESILALSIAPTDPEAETASGSISFRSGLIGRGQPVDNVLTVDGGSGDVCNFETSSVNVTIAPPAAVGPFLPGDSNNDGLIDIADPVWTINAMFRDGPASPCAIAADSNGDRVVDLADVTYTITYEFMGGPAPADGLECGTVEIDAAGDLTCDDSSCE